MRQTVPGMRFKRGDKVVAKARPEIPGMVRKQHKDPATGRYIAQYQVEWERSPLGYGKSRTTHEWENDLKHGAVN